MKCERAYQCRKYTAPRKKKRKNNALQWKRARRRALNRIALLRRKAVWRLKRNRRTRGVGTDPMEVCAVRVYTGTDAEYSLCPRCKTPMEREYLNYCSFCGQRLAWNRFREGNVEIVRCGRWSVPAGQAAETGEEAQTLPAHIEIE